MKYKHNRKCITVLCDRCNLPYEKPITEYNRNQALNRKSYCSRICSGGIARPPVKHRNKEDSMFLYYLKNVRKRFKEYNITIEDLREQWILQNSLCIYSKIPLELSTHTKIIKSSIYAASLDRIDSNKGYIKGNIQWVSRSINYMKNEMSHDDTVFLCNLIATNLKN